MRIQDVKRWPLYTPEGAAQVQSLVNAGRSFDYSGQDPVLEIERRFSRIHDDAPAVTFNSGTSAIFAALAALGIGPGDEVIAPVFTFVASATPAFWTGATPVFADSERDDPSVSLDLIKKRTTDRTKAVIVTHVFGNPVDLHGISAFCRERRLALVEDCSHAHASQVDGKHVGTFGDAAIYSLGAAKLVSGGHGGILVTKDPAVHDRAMLVGHFKPRTRTDLLTEDLRAYAEVGLGGNLRMSPLSAALALDHLVRIDELSQARCANVRALDAAVADRLVPVHDVELVNNRTHYDVVYLLPDGVPAEARGQLVDSLLAAGVPVGPPSTRPLGRVLRKAARHASNPNLLVDRLLSAANAVLPDSDTHANALHDRMISFPADRMHSTDTTPVSEMASTARKVIGEVLGGSR